MIDFKQISAELLNHSEAFLEKWLADGKRVGAEWIARNPRRADSNPGSFKINIKTGVWQDFADGSKGGDLISLYAYLNDITQGEAAKDLGNIKSIQTLKPSRTASRQRFEPTGKPGPIEATARDMEWKKRGEVVRWWAVRDINNKVYYYDVRFKTTKADGSEGKDILPLTWCRDNEKNTEGWHYKSFPEPRPLYGHVSVMKSAKNNPIVIVEGMKCAEELSKVLGARFPVVTWQGGGKAVHKADWAPIADRNVIIWPDADDEGYITAMAINSTLKKNGCRVVVVNPHDDAPKAWDVADMIESGADRTAILEYIKRNKVSVAEFRELRKDSLGKHDGQTSFKTGSQINGRQPKSEKNDAPFIVLGHNREYYFYLPKAKGQVVPLRMSAHTKNNLLALAGINYWEDNYPGQKGVGCCWTAAQDDLMRQAEDKGPFYDTSKRGRGAWRDGKDIVIHCGDKMHVNGRVVDPVDYQGEYIYERAKKLVRGKVKESSDALGTEILELFSMFPWKAEVHGTLAAGWAFLSPICGALYWRPHIWITGEPGSGKTWFKSNLIEPFLRHFGLICQGSTSAAGIRQTLGGDALPVMFDEAETNDKKGAERMAEAIEFARQSSLNGESAIIKGSAHGESVTYAPTSMWCFLSVVTAIKHQADQGRITILELCRYSDEMARIKGRTLKEQHRLTADGVARLFTPDNCLALRNRAFNNMENILANIEVFRGQAAEHFDNQRTGDQIGTLLAGAWCLCHSGKVSESVARSFIEEQDWTDLFKDEDHEQDHEQLLRCLLQHTVSFYDSQSPFQQRTIAQIILQAFGSDETSLNAKEALSTIGMFVKATVTERILLISPKHKQIEKILQNTPWSLSYSRILRRFPGAIQLPPRRVQVDEKKSTSMRLIAIDAKQLRLDEQAEDNEQMVLFTPQSDDEKFLNNGLNHDDDFIPGEF